MDLRYKVALSMYTIVVSYCLYTVADILLLGALFAAIGVCCYISAYNYSVARRKVKTRLRHDFTVPKGKLGILTASMILSVVSGFIFCGLAVDCLDGIFI